PQSRKGRQGIYNYHGNRSRESLGPENRLKVRFCQEMIAALDAIRQTLGAYSDGALITRGNNTKFFCMGLVLEEVSQNSFANTDGFCPLLHAIMNFPFPMIALVTGHIFGACCPLALANDYRIMNADRGFISMPPVDLGIHFSGMSVLPKFKQWPQTVRKMLLEGHKFTGKEALEDGVVDFIASPEQLLDVALELANKWAPKARAGVYGLLRSELWGEMNQRMQQTVIFIVGQLFRSGKPKV
ncbi:ClpP/crotonase-like domain-containing protein, partial [Penicillium cinerascens]